MNQYSYEVAVNAAQQHQLLHQYTIFDALEQIINNKALRFTRLDLLNDRKRQTMTHRNLI